MPFQMRSSFVGRRSVVMGCGLELVLMWAMFDGLVDGLVGKCLRRGVANSAYSGRRLFVWFGFVGIVWNGSAFVSERFIYGGSKV